MTDLPAPLVPAEVDLTDFAFMPLDVRRIRDSDIAALESPEACWSAVLLWCASWHQVPAASLSDDDRVLANLAGYGRVVKEWLRVREGALHGWVKCSDGRLYHPVVAEKAIEAWQSKLHHSYLKLKERLRKAAGKNVEFPTFEQWISDGMPSDYPQPSNGKHNSSIGIPPENGNLPAEIAGDYDGIDEHSGGNEDSSAGIPPENALKGQGQGKGEGNNKKTKSKPPEKPGDVLDSVWVDFLEIRKAKRSPLTDTALDAIKSEAAVAGFTLNAALTECCARGWQGFRADWVSLQPPAAHAVSVASRGVI